jgi:hypothetical protein
VDLRERVAQGAEQHDTDKHAYELGKKEQACQLWSLNEWWP